MFNLGRAKLVSSGEDNPEFEMAAYFSSIKYNDPNTHILGQITVKISKMPNQIDQKLSKHTKFTQN